MTGEARMSNRVAGQDKRLWKRRMPSPEVIDMGTKRFKDKSKYDRRDQKHRDRMETGADTMDKNKVASELIRIAKSLVADDNDLPKLAADIENAVKSVFPKSFVRALVRSGISLSGSGYIVVHFALGGGRGEWKGGIIENDPAHTILMVNFEKDGSIEVTLASGFSIYTLPEPGSHLAMGRIKVPFRKITVPAGAYDQLTDFFKKSFTKMRNILQANRDKVYGIELVEDKF
jgi:hypothetical protein